MPPGPSSGGVGYSGPPLLADHAIMLFRIRRNRPKLVERNPEMLGKLCQRSGEYPTGVVDGMATDDTKGDRDHLLWFR
jgi:hypothetical protein